MDDSVKSTSPPPSAGARVLLFDAHGQDQPISDWNSLDVSNLEEHELAWVDIRAPDKDDVERVFQALAVDLPPLSPLFDDAADPLFMHANWFAARAIAPLWDDENATVAGSRWLLVVGPNLVITSHKTSIEFLDRLHENHDPTSRVGQLDADSFAVVLLDRMLTAYVDAVDAFEAHLDKLDVDILDDRVHDGHLPRLRQLLRAASTFRRMLSSHRDLFDALRRPDFRPDRDDAIDKRFHAIAERYERAMDAVENARDLVIGSYELLETRLSQRTNATMRLLTFVTVLLGGLAVIAGVLGMNFEADLFESGSTGFWTTVGAMAAVITVAMFVARWRGWWK